MHRVAYFLLCLVWILGSVCSGQETKKDIPERTITWEKPLRGMYIDAGRVDLLEQIEGKSPQVKHLRLPANTCIDLTLQDSISDPENHFSTKELQRICAASPYMFQSLGISRCNDGERLSKALTILNSQKQLTFISIYRSICDQSVLDALAKFEPLDSLSLSSAQTPKNCSLTSILARMHLKFISLESSHFETTISDLSKNKGLKKICLQEVTLTESDLAGVTENENIREIELIQIDWEINNSEFSVFDCLKKFKNLETLSISGSSLDNYRSLDSLTQLKSLSLVGTNLLPKDLVLLASLKKMETLDISQQVSLDNADFTQWEKLPALRKINISMTSFSETTQNKLKASKLQIENAY